VVGHIAVFIRAGVYVWVKPSHRNLAYPFTDYDNRMKTEDVS
jgi:hypothetical protein